MAARIYTEKDPTETVKYAVDFTNVLASGETLSTSTVSISVDAGTDVSASSMLLSASAVTGALVTQFIGGGVNGATYRLHFLATTSASATYAGVVYLPVNTL